MPETFGFRLKRFALAVDIVDDEIFRRIWGLILEYVRPHLHPHYWALLTEGEVDHAPGLVARDSNRGKPSLSLRTADGSYTGLAAYSYLEAKPLWVVGPNHEPIGPETRLEDEWSGATGLPPFDRSANEGIRTVILVPLRWKGRKLGLLDLQSQEYQECTDRIRNELEILADTLAVLLPLCESEQERRLHTFEAIELHHRALIEEQWPPLTRPQIFVASSGRADPAVMGVIQEVLDRFHERVRVHYWKESSESGNINLAMLKQIQASQFGMCYFSEPADGTGLDFAYQDNPNVVFEAGMLQALTNSATTIPIGWVPIREANSPPAPFDFAQERMIVVRRLSSNRPNLDTLRDELTNRLARMLETMVG